MQINKQMSKQSSRCYMWYFKSFASVIRFLQTSTNGPQTKKLFSPGYNLLFDIITVPSKAVSVSSDEFIDAYGIPQQILFDSLPLWGLSLVLIHIALNLSTHQFTVDFVIKFCTLYTTHTFSCEFHYTKYFLALKIEQHFIARPWAHLSV